MIFSSRLSLGVKLVFVWLVGFCFVFCFVFIILERLFLIILVSSKSIHPLPSGLSQRANSPYLVQKRSLELGWGRGGEVFTLALDPPTRELTLSRTVTALPGPPPPPGGRRGRPGDSCRFTPREPSPRALRQGSDTARTKGVVSAAPPARPSSASSPLLARRGHRVRTSLGPSFAFSAPNGGPRAP